MVEEVGPIIRVDQQEMVLQVLSAGIPEIGFGGFLLLSIGKHGIQQGEGIHVVDVAATDRRKSGNTRLVFVTVAY